MVGATGETGKHVVAQLLSANKNVKAIVRSKDTMDSKLREILKDDFDAASGRLQVVEASLLDLSQSELQSHVKGCNVVVSCLGHNMDAKGMFGQPKLLVTESVQRLTKALRDEAAAGNDPKPVPRFILMGSEGVKNPLGGDDKRGMGERALLSVLRNVIPPHHDNEQAAAAIATIKAGDSPALEWVVVRPTDLISEPEPTPYKLFDKPTGSLFGSGTATRATVGKFMADLIQDHNLWNEWKFKMPVIHNDVDATCKA